jgi:hypothetical protein
LNFIIDSEPFNGAQYATVDHTVKKAGYINSIGKEKRKSQLTGCTSFLSGTTKKTASKKKKSCKKVKTTQITVNNSAAVSMFSSVQASEKKSVAPINLTSGVTTAFPCTTRASNK